MSSSNLDNLLDEDIFAENQQPQGRPTFLLVLCILSWVGIGIGLIIGMWTLWFARVASGIYDTFDNPNTMGVFSESPEWQSAVRAAKYSWTFALIGFASNLLCLAGTIIMFNMRKVGFYIYVVAQITPIVIYFVIMNSLAFSSWTGFSGFFFYFINIAFVVMYGLNVKHMK